MGSNRKELKRRMIFLIKKEIRKLNNYFNLYICKKSIISIIIHSICIVEHFHFQKNQI